MKNSRGFTLIELLVVVLIIGILSAIAVPQYFKVVEKGRFAETQAYISTIKGAQERYMLKYGAYATAVTSLDTTPGALSKFTASAMTATTNPNWTITLTRNTPVPATYGGYIVTYVGPVGTQTCNQTDCTADLLP